MDFVAFIPFCLLLPWGPAQAQNGLPTVPDARMADVAKALWSGDTYGLYKCTSDPNITKIISCDIGLTKNHDGFLQYISDVKEFVCSMTDNFRIDHSVSGQYFVNGRGLRQNSVRLAKDDWAWLTVEFSDAAPGISSARISCGPKNWNPNQFILLTGPVEEK